MSRQDAALDPILEEGMATHSSILACRIPWTEELAGYSPGSQRAGHRVTKHSTADLQHCVSPCCTANESVHIDPPLFRLFSCKCHYRVLSRGPCAILLLLFDH